MRIPTKPRVTRSIRAAWDCMQREGIRWLPVDPFAIAHRHAWGPIPVGAVATRARLPRHKIINGKDGSTLYCDGEYRIIYNERIRSRGRIRWTIAHEIGHIVLSHLEDFTQLNVFCNSLTVREMAVLDREADIFAAELLAPMSLLRILGICETESIMQVCSLSREAAENRRNDMTRYRSDALQRDAESFLGHQFRSYLKPVAACVEPDAVPGAGATTNDEVKLLERKHPWVPTDESGRYLECPMCGNTTFSHDAKYCRMCGMYLYNVCTPGWPSREQYCGRINPGDARFCEQCGSPTLLTHMGLLMSWEEVVKAHGQIAAGLEPGLDPEPDKGVPF